MKIKAYMLNAFTKDGKGGNPAGVVLDTKGLTTKAMQAIANKLNFSETAFVLPSVNTDYEIKYFTPNEEVAICGHATIATFSLLVQIIGMSSKIYSIKTKAGVLSVEVHNNKIISLQQNLPEFLQTLPCEEIMKSLSFDKEKLIPDMPIQIVSTGLRDIIIPVRGLSDLLKISPNMKRVAEISKRYNVTGYHVFTLETLYNSTAHCRNFSPLFGIPEESATGTSNAALACYLIKHNKKFEKYNTFTFEQGHVMNKPSEIVVNVSTDLGNITDVQVGGFASNFQEVYIFI
ncbi:MULTISPECIES: PhzF family phenazine biosynthesis protein [unclassified Bacillus (in: firmicutes)]|uniref:PhzF family phenazine biosynthesis protein n=1 Tax=unclassified Bacillus (in: firmicutes) TaxID=185979 RepID=UPI0008F25513|nr:MULTISPECIES: PhzF family phenazine biosynthesis protein [unclassified Bacillus (in: firmicutes)]SFJ50633.1 phenazine biosynthesis protein PhzF family [Bacillus sp. 71mf]SFT04689.1 phenazine biosynthesis protein PhzF family [Bacillus sp. 103mf]